MNNRCGQDRMLEEFTSEINATLNSSPDSDGLHMAVLSVSRPTLSSISSKMTFDEDGDLIRSVDNEEEIQIHLRHSMSTSLSEVGAQLWGGSLLLADWIISHPGTINGNVLEIGSGTGLTALAAGLCISSPSFSSYIVTDLESNLKLIKNNFALNQVPQSQMFAIRSLDLLSQSPDWIRDVDIVLGGDIIYDEDLTDGILKLISSLKKSTVLYFGIEKRYVFTNADLDIVPHSYNYFLDGLCRQNIWFEELKPLPPQKFCYHRSKDLTLLKVVV